MIELKDMDIFKDTDIFKDLDISIVSFTPLNI